MWLYLPSACSHSALDTADLTSDSSLLFQALESSVTWRSKHMPARFWRVVSKRVGWIQHLCGRTLPPSTAQDGVDSWIASLRASRASRIPTPASSGEQQTTAGSGRTLPGSFAWWDRDSSSWRTCQVSFLVDLDTYSGTWPTSGTMLNGMCSVQARSGRHTFAGGSSSWPTPNAADGERQSETMMRGNPTLLGKVRYWATAMVRDYNGLSLEQVEHWATPRVSAERTSRLQLTGPYMTSHALAQMVELHSGLLPREIQCEVELTPKAKRIYRYGLRVRLANPGAASSSTGQTSPRQLNVRFVEWLMGLPIGWTDAYSPLEATAFERWATESCRSLRRLLS